MVACVPIHISRQRNALAIALTMSIRRLGGTQVSIVPSGARTSFRPPRLRIEGRSPFCEVLWNFAPTQSSALHDAAFDRVADRKRAGPAFR
jgi:hypothetical protein